MYTIGSDQTCAASFMPNQSSRVCAHFHIEPDRCVSNQNVRCCVCLVQVGWAESMPWLYYPPNQAELFLDADDVQSKLRFRGGSLEANEVSQLTFVAAAYNLTGAYLGLELFEDQLQVLLDPCSWDLHWALHC